MDEFKALPPEDLSFEEPVAQVNNEGISFTMPTQSPMYTEPGVDVRAQKYNYAIDVPIDEAKAILMSGEENRLKDLSAIISRSRTEAARLKLAQMGQLEVAANTPLVDPNPETAFEAEWGAKVSTSLPAFFNSAGMNELLKEPQLLDAILDRASEGYTQKEVLASVFQKWAPKLKESTIAGGWSNVLTSDFAELLVPFLSMYRLNKVAGKYGESGVMSSTNLEEMVGGVLRLPPEQAKVRAEEILDELFSRNAYDAAAFLSALDAYTTSDKYWDNFFDVLNLPIASTPAILAYSYKKASNFIRPEAIKLSGVAEAGGDINVAARFKVTERLQDLMKTTGTDNVKVMLDNAPTLVNPEKVITPTANFSSRMADRLLRELNTTTENLTNLVSDAIRVKRLDEGTNALKVAYDEAEIKIRERLGHVSGAIMDVRPINADSNIVGVAGVEARIGNKIFPTPKVVDDIVATSKTPGRETIELKAVNQNARKNRSTTIKGTPDFVDQVTIPGAANDPVKIEISMGKLDATFFDTEKQAMTHATDYYGLKPGTFSVRQEAPGRHYISIIQQIDENTPNVKKALIDDLRGKEPNDWTSRTLRKLGSAENLNSVAMSANRKIAAYGTTDILAALEKHFVETFKPLTKDEIARFKALITKQRDYESPKGDIIGRFSKNQMEFETEWRQLHGDLPSEAVSNAYWKMVHLSDFDWALRNMSEYTKMSQEGWEMIGLNTKNFKMKKPLIEGKIVKEIPDHPNYPVVVTRWDKDGNHSKLTRKEIKELLAQGYKIVKLHSTGARKLESVDDLRVPKGTKYILTDEVTQAPLSLNRVAYRPGGHRVHVDDWFVSSELVSNTAKGTPLEAWRYRGDFNISSHMIRGQAEKLINRLEEARKIYLSGDEAGLARYITDNLPSDFTVRKFKNLFEKEGLNPNASFKLRRKDVSLADAYDLKSKYKNFLKEADNPHNLDEALEDTAFVGQRETNLPSYTFEGTPHNPVIRTGTSRLLDPLSTLARSTASAVRGVYMDDMKIKHAQDFMARFGDLVDVPSNVQAQLNPIQHAISTPFKEGVKDFDRLASAKAYRESIKNFLGIDDITQTEVKVFRDRMLNSIYKRFGLSVAEMAEPYLLHRINDSAKYLRAAAFHTKIGLFNIPSFLTQAMQFTTMAGIAGPVRAVESLTWGFYAQAMRHASPSVQKAIAKKAGEWGGAPKDFEDFYEALKRSGIMTVRGAVADLDDDKAFKVARSAVGAFLDYGRTPFDKGEQLSRYMAFQIAFREWRKDNGVTKAITDDDLRLIVQRSDVLTGNMTRASVMSWQKGLKSLPIQFLNWHIRMTEQMLGSTLKPEEKIKLMITNSILYGAPAGVATIPLTNLVPWKPAMDQVLNSYGIDPKESGLYDFAINGAIGGFFRYMSGDGFNPNERFGPGVVNPIWDKLLNDEDMFITTLTGVAGSTIQDMARLSLPLVAHIGARIGGLDTDLTTGEIVEELKRSVSSLNNLYKTIAVVNTGQYLSKNGKLLAETDNWKGFVTGLTGLQPEAISEASSKQTYLNLFKNFQKTLEPGMLKLHRNMMEAAKQNDMETMDFYEKKLRAQYAISGMTEQEIARFEKRALENLNRSWLDIVNSNLSKRNEKQFQRILREEERNAGRE